MISKQCCWMNWALHLQPSDIRVWYIICLPICYITSAMEKGKCPESASVDLRPMNPHQLVYSCGHPSPFPFLVLHIPTCHLDLEGVGHHIVAVRLPHTDGSFSFPDLLEHREVLLAWLAGTNAMYDFYSFTKQTDHFKIHPVWVSLNINHMQHLILEMLQIRYTYSYNMYRADISKKLCLCRGLLLNNQNSILLSYTQYKSVDKNMRSNI